MTLAGVLSQVLQVAIALALAPLLVGWINQCRAWLQNRSGPGVLQPYRLLLKLLEKDAVIAVNASWLFRLVPYVVFASTVGTTLLIPLLAVPTAFDGVGDLIVLAVKGTAAEAGRSL